MTETCNSCEYYDEIGKSWGVCRRYPPRLVDPEGDGIVPKVAAKGFCGEHSEAMNITTMLRLLCDTMCREDVSGGG